MPDRKWRPSVHGGWFAVDSEGNYWHMTANEEVVTVTLKDGEGGGMGWTPEEAWRNANEGRGAA